LAGKSVAKKSHRPERGASIERSEIAWQEGIGVVDSPIDRNWKDLTRALKLFTKIARFGIGIDLRCPTDDESLSTLVVEKRSLPRLYEKHLRSPDLNRHVLFFSFERLQLVDYLRDIITRKNR